MVGDRFKNRSQIPDRDTFSQQMREPLGNASQRVFTALSEKNGAFGAYGMSPLAGCVGFDSITQPVCESCDGIWRPPPLPVTS